MKILFVIALILSLPACAFAKTGVGNEGATAIAAASASVQRAYADLKSAAGGIGDRRLAEATRNGLAPETCIAHRVDLTDKDKQAIVTALIAQGFLKREENLTDGVFPPVVADESPCPHLPQPIFAAPGGNEGSHHDWPGGLVQHEAFNLRNAHDLAEAYHDQSGLTLDRDTLTAAVIWHDWAKSLVFQWRNDGTEMQEISIAGTGAHHILGLAETMRRGLPPSLVQVQACAHAAPEDADRVKVDNWLRAAAIIARVDAGTYLPAKGVWPEECHIHTLSDQNWMVAEPAAVIANESLAAVAGAFGFDPTDVKTYNWRFRMIALSTLGADRIAEAWRQAGDRGVVALLEPLKARGLF
ncbi:hypothetical protein [Asticcacaulis benevestitus]|uniref:HD domain-containing protein n=1 Tax=Asticcacaulis benevestitus DSM 16100 = ATCC BAA-896 TaxID=1121022 RepID=V4QYL9_9CAUL|nr:hypothetical protein [Asticcacaulis benevestitus]ESQ84248.1 hypothetical protein ABENE_19690 [Asticcacaulis benevestitus DSM 16100 = ATCC BAA-896]